MSKIRLSATHISWAKSKTKRRRIGDHLKPQNASKLACIFGSESATSFLILLASGGKKCDTNFSCFPTISFSKFLHVFLVF